MKALRLPGFNVESGSVKRPAFQFYPGDWLNDAALRMVSVSARGLWIEMICLMHQGSDYGYLKVNHKVILPSNLARMSGATLVEVEGWLGELEEAGVFARDEEGCIFSRRMIRDERVRAARAAGGKLGGNPNLKVGAKDNLQANLPPTPSSSSSSSSSSSKRKDKSAPPVSDADLFPGVDQQVVADFKALRKQKKAAITPTAMADIVKEATKAGMSLDAALRVCCARGWAGFKADWVDRGGDRRREGGAGLQGRPESRHSGFENIDYSEGIEDGRIV